jgi:hypothetical protein
MQQREAGATIFQLPVAPTRSFSVNAAFLLPFGAKTVLFRRKRTANAPF